MEGPSPLPRVFYPGAPARVEPSLSARNAWTTACMVLVVIAALALGRAFFERPAAAFGVRAGAVALAGLALGACWLPWPAA